MVTEPDKAGIVTVAVPDLPVSFVEVALTVRVDAVSLEATVKFPLLFMEVPVTPPVTDQLTVCSGLLVPATVAVNCCVLPLFTVAVDGLTVTLVTVGAGTVTVAVPDLLVSSVEVALTVKVAALWPEDIVKSPLASIAVPVSPPVTDQLTVNAGLLVPFTVAVNCCVAFLSKVTDAGLTVTFVTVGLGACAAIIGPTVLLLVILPSYPVLLTVNLIYLFTSPAATT